MWISEGGALGFDVRLAGLHGLEGALQQVVELPTQELGSLGDGLPGAAGGKRGAFEFFMINSCFLHENGLYLFSLKVFLNED